MSTQDWLWISGVVVVIAAALGRRYTAAARVRQRVKERAYEAASAARDHREQQLMTERIRAYVSAIDLIHGNLRWRGETMKIVGWGARNTTRSTTAQSILCQTDLLNWVILELRIEPDWISLASLEAVREIRARQFMEPYVEQYIKLFGDPLPA